MLAAELDRMTRAQPSQRGAAGEGVNIIVPVVHIAEAAAQVVGNVDARHTGNFRHTIDRLQAQSARVGRIGETEELVGHVVAESRLQNKCRREEVRIGATPGVLGAVRAVGKARQALAEGNHIDLVAGEKAPEQRVLLVEFVIDSRGVLVQVGGHRRGREEIVGAARKIRQREKLLLNLERDRIQP